LGLSEKGRQDVTPKRKEIEEEDKEPETSPYSAQKREFCGGPERTPSEREKSLGKEFMQKWDTS